MYRRKKRAIAHGSKVRTYSFLATLALITIIVGASYYSSSPRVGHIPDSFHFQSRKWMSFVPQTAQYVAFIDYGSAYAVSENALLFGARAFLRFYQFQLDIMPQSILCTLDIQLPPSSFNLMPVTSSVIKLHNDTMSALLDGLARTKISKTLYDGYPVYTLLMVDPSPQQKLISAYVAIVDDSLVIATDASYGKYSVETILDQYTSNARNLFDRLDVRRGVYASGVADKPCLGLFVGNFATQFNNTHMIVKSVSPNARSIHVTRSILFSNSDFAVKEFGRAHRVYDNANSYDILDQWLIITYDYGLDRLRGELSGI